MIFFLVIIVFSSLMYVIEIGDEQYLAGCEGWEIGKTCTGTQGSTLPGDDNGWYQNRHDCLLDCGDLSITPEPESTDGKPANKGCCDWTPDPDGFGAGRCVYIPHSQAMAPDGLDGEPDNLRKQASTCTPDKIIS